MIETDDLLWQTKLAARLHDPIEKALILMRTAEGHEGGTSKTLREELGQDTLPDTVRGAVKQADQWASAADRAAFPNRNADGRYPRWQQTRFHERPVIIHPLTGDAFDLGKLTDVTPDQAKALALDHLRGLIHEGDPKKTALAFWRFGPAIDAKEIKGLWAQLPADTRVPDHSIHDHLDLTAALAACFVSSAGGPALLAVSLGPVQEFIAASRSTSDLWAGSHLLSRLSWEAMRVICERLGPEAILFPRLRGVPQVDLWLREECGLDPAPFEGQPWTRRGSDANPLFAAALPNRFTAIVPAGQARELAEAITGRVRDWVLKQGEAAYRLLLKTADIDDDPQLPGYTQLREQLAGFPEVHWVSVPWSLVETDSDGKVEASTPRLREAMRPFFESNPPGHLGSKAWQLLGGGLKLEEGWFWRPNPGALYPALHELLERALAAAKSVRPFTQTVQQGWRDSLSGEAEWLTDQRDLLAKSPGKRKSRNDKSFKEGEHFETLWTRVADEKPAWAKKGEHLSALNALKRLWPTLFVNELKKPLDMDVSRFVVSTHTLAIAGSLTQALKNNRELPQRLREAIAGSRLERVALPRELNRMLDDHPDGEPLRRLPGWLEGAREAGDEAELRQAEKLLGDYLGSKPEAYYGLILMDGDQMGAWLSADADKTLPHMESYHPQVRAGLQEFKDDPNFQRYAKELRAPSPSRHMAISEALNHFALSLAPAVAEERYRGRILYAGGDDLMAMLPVIDLLPAMAALRAAYSGIDPKTVGLDAGNLGFKRQGNGFVLYQDRLLRVMGKDATASCGALVAHHQAPLGAVLRELRTAEHRAKEEGKRDAFSLTIVKRSGGALRLTAKWGEPVRLLIHLRAFLTEPDVSSSAVYNSTLWLRDLPEPNSDGDGEMLARLLSYQLDRQGGRQGGRKTTRDRHDLPGLARALVAQAIAHAAPDKRLGWLENFLCVAEFLARETRNPDSAPAPRNQEDAA